MGRLATSGVTDLFQQVPDSHHAADQQTHQVLGVKLIVDDFCGEMKSHRHALWSPLRCGLHGLQPVKHRDLSLTFFGLSGALGEEQLVLLVGEGFWKDSGHQRTKTQTETSVGLCSFSAFLPSHHIGPEFTS